MAYLGAVFEPENAAKLARAADLKSAGGDTVWVRPPPALLNSPINDVARQVFQGLAFYSGRHIGQEA